MDLIDKKNVMVLQIGQNGGQVAGAFEHGPRGRPDAHAELVGNDVCKRGFAEPGRAAEQHVVERLAPAPGRIDENTQVFLDPVLPHEILETKRPQAPVELDVVIILFGLYDSLRHRSLPLLPRARRDLPFQ
jgi:hypothetical protein